VRKAIDYQYNKDKVDMKELMLRRRKENKRR
jgi:hypothetical protein